MFGNYIHFDPLSTSSAGVLNAGGNFKGWRYLRARKKFVGGLVLPDSKISHLQITPARTERPAEEVDPLSDFKKPNFKIVE